MTADDILHTIKAIDWTEVSGVSGDPTVVPDELPALVTGDEEDRVAAFNALRGDLVDDFQWCEAGARVTPILLDLALLPAHPARPRALMLLADLLAGDHVLRTNDGINMAYEGDQKLYAEGPAREILDAILAVGDDLLRNLEDPEPKVRSATALLLGFLSDLAPRAYEPLVRAIRAEREPWVLASLLHSLALVARCRRTPLSASEIDGFITIDSPIAHAFAWLAELYSEIEPPPLRPGCATDQRQLTKDELTPARRQLLIGLFRAEDPPLELFPWSRGHVDRVVTWEVMERGDRAKLFVAGALAEVAAEGGELSDRMAKEALRLCFSEGEDRSALWESLGDLDEGRRAVVAALSGRFYNEVTFGLFGLPSRPWDRLRGLGVEPPSVLERPIRPDEGQVVPLWQRLSELREHPDAIRVVRAEIDAHLEGTDRLEALVFMNYGAYDLDKVVRLDDLYASIRELGPAAAAWARRMLPRLLEHERGNVVGSGVGMALAWAIARELPPGAALPPEYDDLLTIDAAPILRDVFERLPPERREALALKELRERMEPWRVHKHFILKWLLPVMDLVATDAVSEQALKLASQVVDEASRKRDDLADVEALRETVRARLAELRPGRAASEPERKPG